MTSRKVLMGAIPMIVAAICDGANVRIMWGGYQTASTNGRVIRIPYLPLEDAKVAPYAIGYAVHETGHVVGTDFTLFVSQGLERSLLNVFEDVRIEGERMRTLPGARHWLQSLAYALLEDGKLGKADPALSLPDKMMCYLLTYTWVEVLKFEVLRDAAVQCREVLEQSLPPQVFSDLEQTVLKVRNATSTADCLVLAQEVMALLRAQQRQYQAEASQDSKASPPAADEGEDAQEGRSQSDEQGGEAQDNDDSHAQGDAAAASDDDDGSNAQGSGADASDQDSDAQGNGAAANDGDSSDAEGGGDDQGQSAQGKPSGQHFSGDPSAAAGAGATGQQNPEQGADGSVGEHSPAQVAQALQELLDAGECEQGKDIGERIAEGLDQALDERARAGGSGGSVASAPCVTEMDQVLSAQDLIGSVRTQSTALRAKLDEYVQVQTRTRRRNSFSGRSLSRDAGLRLATGDLRIYDRTRLQGRKVDTAFELLVDISTSMAGHRLDMARKAAVALSVALEDIEGAQLAVSAFGGGMGTVTRVVRFGESLRKTAGRFQSLHSAGSTPMAEGLMVGHTDLLNTDAARKVALVITDGEPDDGDAVLQMVEFGTRLGIEHMGIGIGMDATPHLYFPTSCLIGSVEDLPRAVIGMVQAHLFEDRLAA